ncbi:MAG: alpha/beta hydrolase [Bacteroides sp.]|nr:alpha/beta hydrolase [Bacteroides sp.]
MKTTCYLWAAILKAEKTLFRITLYTLFLLLWTSCTSDTVKEGYIPVDEGTLYYQEAGTGEPLILIHGHSLDHRMWEPQFYEFAKKYRTIRYDVRGYGRSSSQHEEYQFTHAADLVQLMDALQIEKAHLVGLSMGGFIGADMVACYPERVRSAVLASGNIRKSPGPGTPMDEEEAARRDKEIAELKAKGVDVMKEEWFEGLMKSGGTQRERMREPLRQMIRDWDAWQPLHKEARVIIGMDAYIALQQNNPETPVLLVEGKAPGNRYSENPDILNYLPNGKLIVLDDCGHMLTMEQPEAFNKTVLNFLSTLTE